LVEKVDKIEKRMDNLETKVDKIEKRMDNVIQLNNLKE
jgi:tetrahydromethanopterin S-methyltransferase subunit B